MSNFVFDASALLDYFFKGSHASAVRDILKKKDASFYASSVQVGEVFYRVAKNTSKDRAVEIVPMLEQLGIKLVDFSTRNAVDAAALRLDSGLAFADSAAASLAIETNSTLVTSDPDFERVGKTIKIIWLKTKAG
jgi:predicted nucleic acid-binding protein